MHLLGELLDEAYQVAACERSRAHSAAGLLEELGGVGILPGEEVGDVPDLLAQRRGVDSVLGVVGHLLLAAAVGLVDGACHRCGDGVGVHVHLAAHVSRRTADRLDERGLGAQEPLLVGIEDAHQRDLGEVKPLAQEVDADEDVVLPHAQFPQEFHAPQSVHLAVEIAHAHAVLLQVCRQVLRHALGEGGDEHPLGLRRSNPDLLHEVVDLALGGLHDHHRIDQSGGPDDLLDELAARLRELEGAGGSGQVDGLARALPELLPPEGPVVHGAGQPEAVLDERALAAHVALVHRPDLRHGHVGLVQDDEEVLGEIVEQAVGGRSLLAAVDVPRVVLDAGAAADLAHHLDVVGRAHAQPLRLQELPLALELREPVDELGLDACDRPRHALRPRDIVRRREDVELLVLRHDLTGHGMQGHEALDLVTEHLDAHGMGLVDGEHLERVATHAERAALEARVVAGVLDVDEAPQQRVAVMLLAHAQAQHPIDVLLGRAQPVNRRDGRDHDNVAPGEQ